MTNLTKQKERMSKEMKVTRQTNISELQRALNSLRLEVGGSIIDSLEEISMEHDELLVANERERILHEVKNMNRAVGTGAFVKNLIWFLEGKKFRGSNKI